MTAKKYKSTNAKLKQHIQKLLSVQCTYHDMLRMIRNGPSMLFSDAINNANNEVLLFAKKIFFKYETIFYYISDNIKNSVKGKREEVRNRNRKKVELT
jgi:hypothetical protein